MYTGGSFQNDYSYMSGTSQVDQSARGGGNYAVKYLGIVDGAMGILSRKMPLQSNKRSNIGETGVDIMKVNHLI